MTDVLTTAQRHRCMSRIRGADTRPEMTVRRLVHRLGYRFRLHSPHLPGKPDLVFPRRRKVIFVHGCFWHMHRCRYGRVAPATNARFWSEKRMETKARDKRVREALRRAGWSVLVVWECQTRDRDRLSSLLAKFLCSHRNSNPKEFFP